MENLKNEHKFVVAIFFAIGFISALLRLPGYEGQAFWNDELWRVNLIFSDGVFTKLWKLPDIYTSTTAPIYILIVKILGFFSLSPFSLRLSSLLPGIFTPIVVYLILKKFGGNVLVCVSGAILFCINSEFINFSKELKPYMFEIFIHLICFYFFAKIIIEPISKINIFLLCASLFCALLCSANIVFILPAVIVSTQCAILFDQKCLDNFWTSEEKFFVFNIFVISGSTLFYIILFGVLEIVKV